MARKNKDQSAEAAIRALQAPWSGFLRRPTRNAALRLLRQPGPVPEEAKPFLVRLLEHKTKRGRPADLDAKVTRAQQRIADLLRLEEEFRDLGKTNPRMLAYEGLGVKDGRSAIERDKKTLKGSLRDKKTLSGFVQAQRSLALLGMLKD